LHLRAAVGEPFWLAGELNGDTSRNWVTVVRLAIVLATDNGLTRANGGADRPGIYIRWTMIKNDGIANHLGLSDQGSQSSGGDGG
jgi:hypothetical protein